MTLIYFIIILGITIFVHELGHFIFAKRAGIYVYEFALGMGPRIFKFNRKNDETTYSIRLFPIGGFVQMAGETNEEDLNISDDQKLPNKSWGQRFSTIIAGIIFNFIFAFILFFIIALVSGAPSIKPYIASVNEEYPAYEAGIRDGDQIVKIDSKRVFSTDHLQLLLITRWGEEIEFTVDRDGETLAFEVSPVQEEEMYLYGFSLDGTLNRGFLTSLNYAFFKTVAILHQMVLIITYLVTGTIGLNSLSGPIGIYSIVGEAGAAGLINLVYLNAVISINVGFINLLPIPAFDGGRLAFLIIEKIKGKPIDPELENTIHAIGFFLLLLLMILITFSDLSRVFN